MIQKRVQYPGCVLIVLRREQHIAAVCCGDDERLSDRLADTVRPDQLLERRRSLERLAHADHRPRGARRRHDQLETRGVWQADATAEGIGDLGSHHDPLRDRRQRRRGAKRQRRLLQIPVTPDEDGVPTIDVDLRHGRVVQEVLDGAEPGELVHQDVDHRLLVDLAHQVAGAGHGPRHAIGHRQHVGLARRVNGRQLAHLHLLEYTFDRGRVGDYERLSARCLGQSDRRPRARAIRIPAQLLWHRHRQGRVRQDQVG